MPYSATRQPIATAAGGDVPVESGSTGRPLGSEPRRRSPFGGPLPGLVDGGYVRLLRVMDRAAPAAMRVSLALVFLWFGALKVTGYSPVAALVSATLPWGDPDLVVRALGAVEMLLGLGLLLGRRQRLLLLALAAHLSGTFLTFGMAPQLMVQHGNPLLLTADGEFVLKNLVLISAALLLASTSDPRSIRASARPVRPADAARR